MKLEGKHYAVIAALLTGVATQLLTAQHGWADLASPGFVAGLLIQIASAITAIFVGAPGASAALDQANKNTDLANDSVRAALKPPVDPEKVDPMRFIGTGVVLLVLALQAPGFAQQLAVDRATPPLPTANERLAADVASWSMVVTTIALDTKASWDAPNRGRAFALEGARLGVTFGVTYGLKKLIHRQRPCAPSCGIDNPDFSFPSAHTAFAFSTFPRGDTGPRLAFIWPLALGAGAGRVMAGKHNLTDVLVGAGVGVLTSRIR